LKGAYKKRDRRYDAQTGESYVVRRRDGRRNRRIAVLVLIACALLAVLFVDYLLGEGEGLQGDRLDGADQEQPAVLQEEAEEGKAAGNQAIEDPATSMVLLGEFFTDYAWDPDPGRRANLKMASDAINDTRLKPGETFSALSVLEGLDYNPAKVFANGGIDYTEGGGLCQVSSTLYMAANYAGLEIVDRNPHYAELPYIRPGFDATVWFGENGWGALDMKFKNNTDGDILLKQHINEDGFMVAQIYGEKPTGKRVTMDSEKVEENPQKGITWVTYKTVTENNGKVVEDGVMFETLYSYNPPTPPEIKHETYEPRGSGWVDTGNTTNWNDKD
jgi:VanW like protein